MVTGLSPVVADTCLVSYIYDNDPRASYYERYLEGRRAVVSFQTVEEAWYGAYHRGWGEPRRRELARHLQQYEVIFPNVRLLDICARLRADRRAAGRELQLADAWIAATALLLRCPLVSNDHHFAGIPNLELIRDPSL